MYIKHVCVCVRICAHAWAECVFKWEQLRDTWEGLEGRKEGRKWCNYIVITNSNFFLKQRNAAGSGPLGGLGLAVPLITHTMECIKRVWSSSMLNYLSSSFRGQTLQCVRTFHTIFIFQRNSYYSVIHSNPSWKFSCVKWALTIYGFSECWGQFPYPAAVDEQFWRSVGSASKLNAGLLGFWS